MGGRRRVRRVSGKDHHSGEEARGWRQPEPVPGPRPAEPGPRPRAGRAGASPRRPRRLGPWRTGVPPDLAGRHPPAGGAGDRHRLVHGGGDRHRPGDRAAAPLPGRHPGAGRPSSGWPAWAPGPSGPGSRSCWEPSSPAPPPLPDEPRGWRRMNLLFLARSTWLPTVYALIRLPLSVIQAVAVTAVWGVGLALVALPAYNGALPGGSAHLGSFALNNLAWVALGVAVGRGAAAGRAGPDPGPGGRGRGGGQVAAGAGPARPAGRQDRRAGDQPGRGGRRRGDRTPPDRAGPARRRPAAAGVAGDGTRAGQGQVRLRSRRRRRRSSARPTSRRRRR